MDPRIGVAYVNFITSKIETTVRSGEEKTFSFDVRKVELIDCYNSEDIISL